MQRRTETGWKAETDQAVAQFASYYLQRTYFFDVHPPLGKLLFALMGWLVGYDGHFHFDNIGDSYIANKVPYVAFRAMPAILGALTVSVTYLIMWESGYSLPACVLAAGLILLDNAHIGQTRLILLDATLVFAMACSLLCYIRFYKLRHAPFSRKWWKWLILTGFALSCDISTKYVGVFAFACIGSAVVIDLWDLLDIKRKDGALSLRQFSKHFCARAFGLIVMPFIFYLFWFQVHFAILSRSGPGDDFMSPEFQETLSDNVMLANAVTIDYYDTITLRHKETKAYLHSHEARYPLRYDDGRVSSQGQQVTGYPYNDTNNFWQIIPLVDDHRMGHHVVNHDLVRLRHVVTDTMLLSHDVASPYYPTNQEFTTVSMAEAYGDRFNDTLFEVRIENGKPGQEFKSVSSYFKLIHNPSKVAMWTHTTPLPEWGFRQQEINGNKQIAPSSNVWYVDEIQSLPADHKRREKPERQVKHLPFLQKWFELQRSMFWHNNQLTSSHPYASQPYQWPFLLRGVSFWTNNDARQQIYFLGNPVGWWIASSLLAVYAGIIAADQLSLRRGFDALDHSEYQQPAPIHQPNILTLPHRNPLTPLQFDGLLLPRLGGPLLPLLPHGSTAVPAPLPARTPGVDARDGLAARVYLQLRTCSRRCPTGNGWQSGRSQEGGRTHGSRTPQAPPHGPRAPRRPEYGRVLDCLHHHPCAYSRKLVVLPAAHLRVSGTYRRAGQYEEDVGL